MPSLPRDPGNRRGFAEASDGLAAIETIRQQRYGIAFLDVQMPACSGVELVERVRPAQMPLTIHVTAYGTHAIRAFESSAVDSC